MRAHTQRQGQTENIENDGGKITHTRDERTPWKQEVLHTHTRTHTGTHTHTLTHTHTHTHTHTRTHTRTHTQDDVHQQHEQLAHAHVVFKLAFLRQVEK